MANVSISIPNSIQVVKTPITGEIANGEGDEINKTLPFIAVFALLSAYAMQGSPAITTGIGVNSFTAAQISSISEYNKIEKKLKRVDYSWISSIGFDEEDASYSDMYY